MVQAEIIKIEQDENSNIRVWSNYKIDGVDVPSQYPKIDSKSVFCTRYNASQFFKMTDQEIKDYILAQSKAYAEKLVRDEFSKIANVVTIAKIPDLVGAKISLDSVTINISPTETITIKQDGTQSAIVTK